MPLLWAAAVGAAQPCGKYLTTGGIAPAGLRYNRLTPVARVAGHRCLAVNPLPGCVRARPSPAAAMAPGDVCRCSPAGMGPVASKYRSCTGAAGRLGRPSASNRGRCGSLRPIPLPLSVRVRVRVPGSLGTCSLVQMPFVFRACRLWPLGACSLVYALCAACVSLCWLPRRPPPLFFSFFISPWFFFVRPFVWCRRPFVFALWFFF